MSGPGPQDPRGVGPPPRDDEDDLLALAYGELGGAEERAARARVASDPSLAERLGDMERVRSMFSAMEDEEPPPGLSAQLLAQAAQSARPAAREVARQATRTGEGFWARLRAWLAPITAHPGLAAAASILLVAGVAGVLVARSGGDFGRSERQAAESASTAPAPDRAPGPGETAGGAVGGASASAEAPAVGAPAPAAEPAAESAALDEGQAGRGATKADDAERREEVAARPARRARDAAKPRASDDQKPDPATPTGTALGLRDGVESKGRAVSEREEPAKQKSGKDTFSDEDARGDAPTQAPAASPPQAPLPSPSADSSRPIEPAPSRPAPASVAELHKRALSAASSRRCLEVQSIDRTIRTLDPKYSESVFRADRRLATCLPAVKRAKRAK